ncbi:MAG: hypothetical protein JRN45_00535 [Nitrososphaerota archaeon]|nr:hypothetical protein [Nitrososphaerota archaeon]
MRARNAEKQPAEWLNKAWSQVFGAIVEGVEQPPEEPCHKAIRLYGIFTSEMGNAQDSLGDSFADAGYAAADVLNAADTVKLMARDGCISEGFVKDIDEAVSKISGDEGFYDKEDVESAINDIMNMSDRILEDVVVRCLGPSR